MIDHISIKDFAIIENTEIDLEDGLNIMTGETGAGKSIVIEAVSLALGSRADSSFVRHGKDKAYVELAATVDGEQLIISREVSANGKNLCRLNGHIVTLSEIQNKAAEIADIHGQYDNQLLLDQENQLRLVDAFNASRIDPIKAGFADSYREYKAIRAEYDALVESVKESERKKDFYEFEVKEIADADPAPGEDEELSSKISILSNSETIYNALSSSAGALDDGEPSVLSLLGSVQRDLSNVSRYSDRIKTVADAIDGAYYELESQASEIKDILGLTDYSQEELDASIKRLDVIEELKKKYGGSIESVLAQKDKIEKELSDLDNFDARKAGITARLDAARTRLKENAATLSAARKAGASILSGKIAAELRDLNFADTRFSIEIEKAPAITSEGADEAQILISLNPGEPLLPLSKIASGGELSRIMLAIKSVACGAGSVPTMIFDEIDAGISGVTASVVARKLIKIARDHQIICITHLPQITAAGETNYRITKTSDSESTYTSVEKLSDAKKTEEVARLLGGDNVTGTTLESARELIDSYH